MARGFMSGRATWTSISHILVKATLTNNHDGNSTLPVYVYIYIYMMHGFCLKSGQLVNEKSVSVLSFSNFRCICCLYRFW